MTPNTTARIAEKFIGLSLDQRRQFLAKLQQEGKDFSLLPIVASRHSQASLPLSYAQQRLLFLWQMEPASAAYNMAAALRLTGELDEARLQGAFDSLLQRHEALRTVFHIDGEQAEQRVLPAAGVLIERIDLRQVPAERREQQAQAEVEAQVAQPFDLLNGPLLRATLLRLGDSEQVLLVCMHHIVSDGWSMDVMVREFVQAYQAGGESLPALPLQYADYALWQRRWLEAGEGERQLAYWREQLGDEHPLLDVAPDFPRPAVQSFAGETLRFDFGPALSQRMQALARSQGVTLFMLTLAGYALFLARHSGQRDIRIGVPNANRGREEVEGLIGFFINTQVLRCQVDWRQSFTALLSQVRETGLAAQAHQELPFEQLVEALQPERSLGHNPLFQAKFNQNVGMQRRNAVQLPGLSVAEYPLRKVGTHFDLALDITDDGHTVHGEMTYASDLYQAASIQGFIDSLRALFEQVLEQPDAPLFQMIAAPVAPVAVARSERPLVLERWNQQVAQQPQATAAVYAGQSLSTAELDVEAERLAAHLQGLGVRPGQPVAVLLERSLDWLVCLLASSKAGAVYMPLDVKAPSERLVQMLQRAGAGVVICAADDQRQAQLAEAGCQVLAYAAEQWQGAPARVPVHLHDASPAYVIHTSGSTGQPKGVLVSQGALASYTEGLLQRLALPEGANLALVSTIAADLGHTLVFAALCAGRPLHIVEPDVGLDPDRFAAYMAAHAIAVLKIVPSHLNGLLQASQAADVLPSQALIVGGEACSQALYQRVRELKPGCRFINHYGPSETTVGVLTHEQQGEAPAGNIALGTALPGAHLYVLDDLLNPVPERVAGELYIGGASVAQGYLGQAALTAERFVPDPYGPPGARVYRSGDRVRRSADGLLHFLGRVDDQVKIRGYRVEPGEVAKVLRQLPGVQDAAVLALPVQEQLQLVAYCVATVTADALKEQLQASLPDYLVPAHILLLDRLPLTANGKLDRRALPSPQVQQSRYTAPSNEVESTLAAIWQEVLKVAQVGVHDNFFELGGDSILSLQIIARAKRQGLKLTPRQLFEKQTVAQLAQVAKPVAAKAATALASSIDTRLLPVQQRFFELGLAQPQHYNQAVMLQLRQPLSAEVLSQALQGLQQQHAALRFAFQQEGGQWLARARSTADSELLWQREAADADELTALAEQAQRSLDLHNGPLLRAVLFSLADGSQRLLLVVHHLVVDGVSWRILLEDLQALCGGVTPDAASSSQQQWAEQLGQWTQQPAAAAELAYWQTALAGQGGELPGARRDASLQVQHSHSLYCRLDAEQTRQLLQQAPAAYRTQVNDLLLTALARTLCYWSGQERALIQLEGHGREALFDSVDLSRSVGWFTSLFPLSLTPADDLGTSISQIKEQLRAVPNKGVGFGALRYLGNAEQQHALAALPQPRVTFNYLGQFDQAFAEDGLFAPASERVGATQSEHNELGNWLSINGQVLNGELELGWTFSREMFDEVTIGALAERYLAELQQLIGHCLSIDGQAGGATPSDFPLAGYNQAQLQELAQVVALPLREIEAIYPLSPMQEGLLMHTLLEPGSGIYMMQYCYSVESAIDAERFRQAWQGVAQRHDALRTRFSWTVDERMVQVVQRTATPDVQIHDWRQVPAERYERALLDMLAEERRAGFDLQHAVPFRLRLIQLDERRFGFVLSNHHILIDAWCRSLLMDEFFAIYAALGEQRAPALAPASQYADFIAWLQQQDQPASERFWREQLAGFEQPTSLPFDRQPLRDNSHSVIGDVQTQLSREQGRQLQQTAQQLQLTVNTLVQAAWALVLHRYSGARDLLYGVTVAGRPVERPEMQRTVGLFINSIALRVHLPEAGSAVSVGQWLQELFALNLRLREHEHLPLVDIQACSEIGKGQPLFDSLFVFENAPIEDGVMQQAQSLNVSSDSGRTHTNYPMTVVIYPGEALGLHLSYDKRWFDENTVQQLLADFRQLLLQLASQPEQRFDALPLLTAGERQQLLVEFNQSQRDYPLHAGYATLFEQQVVQHPQRVAARCLEEEWNYAELDQQANRLAQALRRAGVQPDQPVALLAERGLPLLGMIVGTLKAGGGYLPLDPHLPAERLRHILTLSRAPVLVCTAECVPALQPLLAAVDAAQRPQLLVWEPVQDGSLAVAPQLAIGPRHLAYVIYTSGSTGLPKGVMVEQAGMLNNQLSKLPYLNLSSADVIAQTASQSFDISVWQFLTAALCGARVEIVPDQLAHDPQALLAHVNATGITVLESVPSLIQGMLEGEPLALPTLRWMLTTGEAMPPELARRWLQRYPDIPLINAYGPAECSDDVSLTRVSEGETASTYLPIGLPTDNNLLHVLDGQLELVGVRAVGELCVSGTGVGRGYVGDPVRTALAFVPDPFATQPGQRLYRTGDLARRRTDGVLEYVGRRDHQVKIRGFRIELGEIEARLSEQPGVRDSAVLAQDQASGRHLVAYVVADRTLDEAGQRLLRDQLKAGLKRHLPEYMVPQQWGLLEAMPLNANGKLDRKALAAIDSQPLQGDFAAPHSELQIQLAQLWQELLQIERVGLHDNFFELGGHSLLLVRVISRLKNQLGVDLPMQDFYRASTVAELAALIEQSREQGAVEDDYDAIFAALDELEEA